MKSLLFTALLMIPAFLFAQDYTMYETIYIKALPGHNDALEREIAEHNKAYHSERPYSAYVFNVLTGPRMGQYFWGMGPCTWTDLDSRPAGEHDTDWDNSVLAHGKMHTAEYWIRVDGLSYLPAGDDRPRPLHRLRFIDVENGDLWFKVQGQIKATVEAMATGVPRAVYRNDIWNKDGRDYAVVWYYQNWAERDADGPGFRETFEKVHGADSWATFIEEISAATNSAEDEWRMLIPELSAEPGR